MAQFRSDIKMSEFIDLDTSDDEASLPKATKAKFP